MGVPGGILNQLGGPSGIATELKVIALATLLGLEGTDVLQAIESGEIKSIADLPKFLTDQLDGAVRNAEETFGGPLWELLVRAPAGLDAAAIDAGQAKDAVAMVKRMLGFGLALPLITARLETVIKGVLGAHAPEGLLESIRRLPEEIGVNFFIGTVLERIFETAVATPLEEAIAQQTRPARFDWRVVKLLLTKHHITPEAATSYLQRIGYRDEDIAHVLELGEQFLTVADVQQLFLAGEWTEEQSSAYLATLGYSPTDAATLVELYLTRAETTGGQQLRLTARAGYLEGKITEDEYRLLLKTVYTPAKSIDLEVESANLQLSWGRRQLSVANLKTSHQQGHINDRQAITQLERIGFVQDDALQLIETWTAERKATHAGLSGNRILAYLLGGVLTQAQALALLTESGMKVEDASLLVKHPGQLGGVYAHRVNQTTVLSALREGVIDVESARSKLAALDIDPDEIELSLAATVAKMVRGQKPRAAHKALTEAQIIRAWRLGLASDAWAAAELAALGYTDADAGVLLAIEETSQTGAAPAGWVTLT